MKKNVLSPLSKDWKMNWNSGPKKKNQVINPTIVLDGIVILLNIVCIIVFWYSWKRNTFVRMNFFASWLL